MPTCVRVALAFGLAIAPASAIAQDSSETAPLRIAFIAKSYANPVFLAAHRGAPEAARRLGTQHGLSVEVLVLTPTGENPEQQAQRIEMAVEQGVQAIAVAASEAATVTKAIDAAVGKGVAVMTFDVDLPESRRFAHYGVDDLEAGRRVIDELAELIGGPGKVAVLAGNPDAPNLRRRVEGVEEAAARHSGVEIVGVFHHVERPLDAAEEVIRVNAAHPDLKGWAMVGGWPLFSSNRSGDVMKDLESRNLKVVAIDALPEQLVYVDRGIAVLLAQPVYEWGSVSVQTIVDRLRRDKGVSGSIPMPLVRVSRESLGAWARQLRDWGFSPVPEEYLSRP